MKICDAETIASSGNSNQELDSLYKRNTYLKRMPDGGFYLHHTGGAAMHVPRPTPMDRNEAIQWIVDNARDPVTDYGYTEAEAIAMLNTSDGVSPSHPLAAFTTEELQAEITRRINDPGVTVEA
jgi:hypothetical protein